MLKIIKVAVFPDQVAGIKNKDKKKIGILHYFYFPFLEKLGSENP